MDNNNNFEQQFTQKVKATAAPLAEAPIAKNNSDKLPLIIAIVLAIVTLVESIILIITLNNYFSFVNVDNNEYSSEDINSDFIEEDFYTYDEDFNLTAFSLTCTTGDGSSYSFGLDNKYKQINNEGLTVSDGSYTITNGDLVALTDSNKVLYYDGLDIADGLTIYTCKEASTETDIDEDIED